MPKLIGLATRLVTLVAIGALPACAPQAPETPMHDPAADRAAVDAVREREMAALNGAHTDSLASVYADDIVMMPPNEPTVTGGAALRTYVEGMFQQATVAGSYTSSNVEVAGDWAIDRYTGELTITPKAGGKATTERIKGLHIYRRQPDGSWKIVQDIWNVDPPVTPAAK